MVVTPFWNTASGSIGDDCVYFTTTSATTTIQCPTILSTPFALGFFETEDDYRSACNNLRLEEHRKDIFRAASIIPKTTEHTQRIMRQIIPAKRNFSGKQSSRF